MGNWALTRDLWGENGDGGWFLLIKGDLLDLNANAKSVGMLKCSDDDQVLAKAVQKELSAPQEDLDTVVKAAEPPTSVLRWEDRPMI